MRIVLIDPSNFSLPYDKALANGLAAEGHEVHVVGRALADAESWNGTDVPLHTQFYRGLDHLPTLPPPVRLPMKGLSHAATMLRLPAWLRRLNPDVIHFQWFALPIADSLRLRALRSMAPVVLTMHDVEPFNGTPSSVLQRWGILDLVKRCDRVIVHTDVGRQRLASIGVPKKRLAVLPHGPLADLPPRNTPPAGPLTFLLFGKMKPYKGIDVLIEAVARMPPDLRTGCRFVIAGKPYMDIAPLREAVARHRLDDIVSFDTRFFSDEDMAELLSRAGALVFPYREIEASGVLSIALGLGRPIIASRIGSFAETLTDGADALLVPPDDAEALSRSLTAIAFSEAERRRLGDAARTLAEHMPGWRTIARRTLELYGEALAERATTTDRGESITGQPVRTQGP